MQSASCAGIRYYLKGDAAQFSCARAVERSFSVIGDGDYIEAPPRGAGRCTRGIVVAQRGKFGPLP